MLNLTTSSPELDARLHHNPDPAYAADLVARAAAAIGSRNLLVLRSGISRRRLGYIEAGHRTLPNGNRVSTEIRFAEQVILEAIASG